MRRKIKKDQLIPEASLVGYCIEDSSNSFWRIRMDVDGRFITAARRDKLIRPLLEVEEDVRNQNGIIEHKMVGYYSRHQIFLMIMLRGNKVNENGRLETIDEHARGETYGAGRKIVTKAISWGRTSWIFHHDDESLAQNKRWLELVDVVIIDFHNFLELLHSLDPKTEREISYEERIQRYNHGRIMDYNLQPLEHDGEKTLSLYGLDSEKLNKLRKNVGWCAQTIDPLAHWYYYINRHPQSKKDLLTGEARIAQEMYRLYDLITVVWEKTTGKKSGPLIEVISEGSPARPYNSPKVDFMGGEDVQALRYAIEQFEKWKDEDDNKQFINDGELEEIVAVKDDLIDYEKRYGDRTYAGSLRHIQSEDIELDKLDEQTRKLVECIISQTKDTDKKLEIGHAIMSRLGDLKRSLRDVFYKIEERMSTKSWDAWHQHQNFGAFLYRTHGDKMRSLSADEQRKFRMEELKRIEEEARYWSDRGAKFNGRTIRYTGLALCKVCRKCPVQIHVEKRGGPIPDEAICDKCVDENKKNPVKLTAGKWSCMYCGESIYKFAHNNILSTRTETHVPIVIEIEYGSVRLEAVCKNKKCGKTNYREMDWGWLP
jgi:hypothetical protein